MTRGRPPRQAIREARAIAEILGAVVELPSSSRYPGELMIFCTRITLFVRVKRTRSHISDIGEIVDKFKKDLLCLCTIPLTDVVLRELWVRSPRGSWQYFRILKEGITEIRGDEHFDRSTVDFEQPAWPQDPVPETVFTRDPYNPWDPGKGTGSTDGTGFTCPFYNNLKGRLPP